MEEDKAKRTIIEKDPKVLFFRERIAKIEQLLGSENAKVLKNELNMYLKKTYHISDEI